LNLNQSPTKGQLVSLIAECDDMAGHHVIWVNSAGDVNIDVVPQNLTPVGFEESKPEMRMRYPTFVCGNDYVGSEAAKDDMHVSRIFNSLVEMWPIAKDKATVTYLDA
jgi:hypothetical protein